MFAPLWSAITRFSFYLLYTLYSRTLKELKTQQFGCQVFIVLTGQSSYPKNEFISVVSLCHSQELNLGARGATQVPGPYEPSLGSTEWYLGIVFPVPRSFVGTEITCVVPVFKWGLAHLLILVRVTLTLIRKHVIVDHQQADPMSFTKNCFND